MATGLWVANNGTFVEAKAAWVAVNGVYVPVSEMNVAVAGTLAPAGIGAKPAAVNFYATGGADSHVALNIGWEVMYSAFDAATDGVFLEYKNRNGTVTGRSEIVGELSRNGYKLFVNVPEQEWDVDLWFAIDKDDPVNRQNVFLGSLSSVRTTGVPQPSGLSISYGYMDPQQTEVVATLNWKRVPYADYYSVYRYYNRGREDGVTVQPSGFDDEVAYHTNLYENTRVGYWIRAHKAGYASAPSNLESRTIADYSPGVFSVKARQKRTLVTGINSKRGRGWRPASDDKIFCGDGQGWNNYGVQIGFIFYWPDNSTNPFAAIKNRVAKGARVTKLSMRVNRASNGFNRGIRPILRTHKYKDFPSNTNGYMHENWRRAKPAVVANEKRWVDIDTDGFVNYLIKDTGNGIALGSKAQGQEDYMVFWKEDTGLLHFTVE